MPADLATQHSINVTNEPYLAMTDEDEIELDGKWTIPLNI
jgi:hypothetical protein